MGRPSRYPQEFREAAVQMVRETDRSIAEVARELGMNEGTLGNWMAKDRRERGEQPSDQVTEKERVELVRLRRENAQLRMEKDILGKAAAYAGDRVKRSGRRAA